MRDDEDLTELCTHTADGPWLSANGVFVAEGRHVARRLLATPRYRTIGVVLTPTAYEAMREAIELVPDRSRPVVLIKTPAELDALTGFRLHQGCVAFAERVAPPGWDEPLATPGVSLLLERVRDADNLGSILRSAAAFGVTSVVLGPECADPFYRKTIRTSMGAVLRANLVQAHPWPAVLERMKRAGCVLVAATPDASAVSVEQLPPRLAVEQPVVLMIGSEGEGLSDTALAAADLRMRIPTTDAVDSLNVAVAAAVAVYALTGRWML